MTERIALENIDIHSNNRLELQNLLNCSQTAGQKLILTSASYPFHVEWVNNEWQSACGWQSDEILGSFFFILYLSNVCRCI